MLGVPPCTKYAPGPPPCAPTAGVAAIQQPRPGCTVPGPLDCHTAYTARNTTGGADAAAQASGRTTFGSSAQARLPRRCAAAKAGSLHTHHGLKRVTPAYRRREGGSGRSAIPSRRGVHARSGLYQRPFALTLTTLRRISRSHCEPASARQSRGGIGRTPLQRPLDRRAASASRNGRRKAGKPVRAEGRWHYAIVRQDGMPMRPKLLRGSLCKPGLPYRAAPTLTTAEKARQRETSINKPPQGAEICSA